MEGRILQIREAIASEREKLLAHPAYANIRDLNGLRQFARVHVFAVWDFMSLLKSLQLGLTSVSVPWMPVGSADTRYLINEIVLGEESDVDEQGERISHFELYLKAMDQMGADASSLSSMLERMNDGEDLRAAISNADIHDNIRKFLHFTFDVALDAPLHVKAAVFTFGREDLIPSMFLRLLEELHADKPERVSIFKYYIERHIEVDGGHHSELAINMVKQLCGDDDSKWREAATASGKALEMRYLLWDAVQNG